ncbi:hypothetical protein GGF37_003357, partial [Kickxella alabastrina]
GKHLPSTGGSGESRVAVNGWTACRVRISRGDPNRQLALRLDAEAQCTEEADDERILHLVDASPDDIEITLDALRRELCARVARVRQRGRDVLRGISEDSHDRPMLVDADEPDASGSDEDRLLPDLANDVSQGAVVDGLARRVESDLALGCIKQRRAAAAAADAISAAANALSLSAKPSVAGLGERKSSMHSRKRKSIPDMFRHAKLSRVPTENSDDSCEDMAVTNSETSVKQLVSERTREQLDYFKSKAMALKRTQAEIKALRYQRRQQLKRAIASALDSWLRARKQSRQRESTASPLLMTRAQSLESLGSSPAGVTPMALPLAAAFGGMLPVVSATAKNDLPSRSARIMVPRTALRSVISGELDLCTQCASTGDSLLPCSGCGDRYHSFCAPPPLSASCRLLLCPLCRVCSSCMDDRLADDLLQCDDCGLLMHAQCSSQETEHPEGLSGLVSESGGRWVCDKCVHCLECDFKMTTTSSDSDELFQERRRWNYDYTLCGSCAPQIEKAKVCPQCVATYSNCKMGTNMVCCDICAFWIHTDCDPGLTPDVYDALITLEDDAPYVCPTCAAMADGGHSRELLGDPATRLPRCLLTASPETRAQTNRLKSCFDVKTAAKTETEVANMLLSLTHSDVRFGRDCFDTEALETRFCTAAQDWRQCALCALHGDGTHKQKPSLGRLIPLGSSSDEEASCHWVHVECLAWAWGPRSVSLSDQSSLTMVRFEGVLLDTDNGTELACTLCARPGASFHCCAPVPCPDAAYHLPCLLLAGSPSLCAHEEEPQYCAGWRRALCPSHAPIFSAMMPADGTVECVSYDSVRVEGCLTNLNPGLPPASQFMTKVGGTVMLDCGDSGLRCLRYFELAGARYTLGLAVNEDELPGQIWQGWVIEGMPVDFDNTRFPDATHWSATMSALLTQLLATIRLSHPALSFITAVASAYPHKFVNVPVTTSAADGGRVADGANEVTDIL